MSRPTNEELDYFEEDQSGGCLLPTGDGVKSGGGSDMDGDDDDE